MTQRAISTSTPLAEAFAGSGGSHARMALENGKVAGLVTMRGVLQAWLKHGGFDGLTAADAMSKNVVTMKSSNNTLHAARLFAEHRVKSIAIVDADDNFLTTMDPQDLIPELTSTLLAFFQPASRVMVRSPYTIAPEATIREAIDTLLGQGISCLIVCKEQLPVGMISESDLLTAVTEGRNLQGKVGDIMSSPISTMPENSNLRQVWEMMNDEKVMKMVLTDYSDHVSGLITATDVLVTISQGLLSTFETYHCPEKTDLMAEWRKSGLIMAASNSLLDCLGLSREELVGLRWQDGFSSDAIDKLLMLPNNKSVDVLWRFDEAVLPFTVTRDIEYAAMWWKLKL